MLQLLPHNPASLPISEFTTAGVVSYVLQRAKNSSLVGFVNTQTAPIYGGIAAFLSAVGVHCTFDGTSGTLMITGLSAIGIATLAWHWVTQWLMQEVAYQTTVQKAVPNTVVAAAGAGK